MLQLIKDRWREEQTDRKALEQMWDTMAEDYRKFEIPSYESDQFLQLLLQHGWLDKGYTALDIGCGTARYDIALAPRLKHITGVDVSSKMIAYGKEALKKQEIHNVTLYNESFDTAYEGCLATGKPYDLVIAHMTPAIGSYEAFYKMMQMGRQFFAYCKPVRRKNMVLEEVSKRLGEYEEGAYTETQIPYLFTTLWLWGVEPNVYYEKQIWKSDHTVEEAYKRIKNRIGLKKGLSKKQEWQLETYLHSIQKDGIIHEETETTIVTFLWTKK